MILSLVTAGEAVTPKAGDDRLEAVLAGPESQERESGLDYGDKFLSQIPTEILL